MAVSKEVKELKSKLSIAEAELEMALKELKRSVSKEILEKVRAVSVNLEKKLEAAKKGNKNNGRR